MFCRNVGSANTAAGNCFICPVYILLCFANSWNYENLFKQEIQTRNNLVLKESHGICYTLNEINPHNCLLVITSVCVCVCVCAYAYDAHFPSGKARSHWVRKRTAFKSEHSERMLTNRKHHVQERLKPSIWVNINLNEIPFPIHFE